MKIRLIVLRMLVIGWVSARPIMAGSSPVEDPGKNSTVMDLKSEHSGVTDNNTAHITDSTNSTEHAEEHRDHGKKLVIEILGFVVDKGDREQELLPLNQEKGSRNSKTQDASHDNKYEKYAEQNETKEISEESVGQNLTLKVIVSESVKSVTVSKQEKEYAHISDGMTTEHVELEKYTSPEHDVTVMPAEKEDNGAHVVEVEGKSVKLEKNGDDDSQTKKSVNKKEKDGLQLGDEKETKFDEEKSEDRPQIEKTDKATETDKSDALLGEEKITKHAEEKIDDEPTIKKSVIADKTEKSDALHGEEKITKHAKDKIDGEPTIKMSDIVDKTGKSDALHGEEKITKHAKDKIDGEPTIKMSDIVDKTGKSDALHGEEKITKHAKDKIDGEPTIKMSDIVDKTGKSDALLGEEKITKHDEERSDGELLHKISTVTTETEKDDKQTDGEKPILLIVDRKDDTPQDAVKVIDSSKSENNTKPRGKKNGDVIKSEGEYRSQVPGNRGGNLNDENRENGKTQQNTTPQDSDTNNDEFGDDYSTDGSENGDDGNNDTEAQANTQNSGNTDNVNMQQENISQHEMKGQNGVPSKPFDTAEKPSNWNEALSASQFNNPINNPQLSSYVTFPQYVSVENLVLLIKENRTSSLQELLGNLFLLQQSQPHYNGNFNAPHNPNGIYVSGVDSSQNLNTLPMYLQNNPNQQYAIPALTSSGSAQGSYVVGTNRPVRTQGNGIVLLNRPVSAHDWQNSNSNAGIYFNPATSSAGSVNLGNRPSNIISPQQPLQSISGQGISGGQVLSPLLTSFISHARPGKGQDQGFYNIGGGVRPVKETLQGSTANNIYYYPTGPNIGDARPVKETNHGTSSNTLYYNHLTGSNIGSNRPNKEIYQGSLDNFAVNPPIVNVGVNKVPFQQVYQGTSGNNIFPIPQQNDYANAGSVQGINQGPVRPGTFTNIGNGVSLYGGSGSNSDFQGQQLYSPDSSSNPASLYSSSSLNLKNPNARPQSGDQYYLKDPINGNPIRVTPFKDSTSSVVALPNSNYAAKQNHKFGIDYGQHQDQFARPQASSIGNVLYPTGSNSAQTKPYKEYPSSGGSASNFDQNSHYHDYHQNGPDDSPPRGQWVFTEPIL